MTTLRTQVAIIGAGPAGLLLARLLQQGGINSIVLESKSREYVEHRQRAGVLEQGTVDALHHVGAGHRMDQEGSVHTGVELLFEKRRHRIDFPDHTAGKSVTLYAQTEVCKDLIALQLKEGGPLMFETEASQLAEVNGNPRVTYTQGARSGTIHCDYICGCDGFWGISRGSMPKEICREYQRVFPFAWLGILADVAPANHELIYARHERGFALLSMRSATVSRYYLQVDADANVEEWTDEAIWDELSRRSETVDGFTITRGPITQKSITPMRSFVHEPMSYGRLFLAGDSAHIVPPTGAKGLNLAMGDVVVLAKALESKYKDASETLLEEYSERCLKRVWQAERFSYDTTNMLHVDPSRTPFEQRLELSKLERISSVVQAQSDFASGYTGFPL